MSNCAYCGCEFVPVNTNQKYCCQNHQRKKWRSRNPGDKATNKNKNYVCATCGLEFVPVDKRRVNTQKYCGGLCREVFWIEKHREDYIPGMDKNRRLKWRYGITLDDYNKMEKEQNGECAICKKKVKLHVDHNHTTKKVRELLCQNCNFGLGNFLDNKLSLLSAIAYLDKHCEEGE